MTAKPRWTKAEQARQVAMRLPHGGVVNLGVGLPTLVAGAVKAEQRIVFHCENGLIGYRPLADNEAVDPDIIDARCEPIQLTQGAAVVAHDLSFAIARGGRLDVTVLGAFQVAANGDLANWTGDPTRISGVGGAMDLAVGAKQVIVMMRHTARDGTPKILESCTLPLTVPGRVGLIVTELAVIRITAKGLVVEAMAPGVTSEYLQELTAAPLTFHPTVAALDGNRAGAAPSAPIPSTPTPLVANRPDRRMPE
jgi:3-oxoacid CoA-transferase B subunit